MGNGIFSRPTVETGTITKVWANPTGRKSKVAGVTFDWTTVAAVSGSDVTLPDGTVIEIGTKYLRYGMVMAKITASGKYGPYDADASDGREIISRGNIFFTDATVLEDDDMSDHPSAYDAGTVFEARMAIDDSSPDPGFITRANLLAAFPEIRLVS